MAIKFKSQATNDLVMTQATAQAVLGLIGKTPNEPGILEPADMPHALSTLKGASSDVPELPKDETGQPIEPSFAQEAVSLRQHAVPLVMMIERAMAENKPIVWGV